MRCSWQRWCGGLQRRRVYIKECRVEGDVLLGLIWRKRRIDIRGSLCWRADGRSPRQSGLSHDLVAIGSGRFRRQDVRNQSFVDSSLDGANSVSVPQQLRMVGEREMKAGGQTALSNATSLDRVCLCCACNTSMSPSEPTQKIQSITRLLHSDTLYATRPF